jgi:putative FmdB family regulatory protein
MPLYEYECKKCHHRFERIQKYSDSHMKKCPDCGGTVELVVSAPAVQFKGSGWYVNDYAKKPSSSSSSNSNGESGSKAESGSKGDSEARGESESKSKKEETSKQESSASTTKKTEKKMSSTDKS